MYDFTKVEKEVGQYWRDHNIFEKSLEKTQKGKRFVFWEGPPTANGQPHTGHFLTRIYKDLYGRYKTMRGFFVLRKAGWDTHGLPVEIEIEKELGFTNKKQIEEYGIAQFNRKARESVWKYKSLWEDMTRRMGFWIDLNNPYVTYRNDYMESEWNILKQFWDKQLLYQAHKVVPFCTRCGTGLSAHEVAQGYKKITDQSVYVKFKLIDQPNTYIIAWTTTPWTLPGNVALAVGDAISYVYAIKDGTTYVVAKDLAQKVLSEDFVVEKEVSGAQLVGLAYEPLFDVPELKSEKSYKIYAADFVSTLEGTGVVHTAVMYGEDDYNLGTAVGLPKFHTVDMQGKFVAAVGGDLAGKFVKAKATEELIIKKLENTGNVFKVEPHEHDYPFCWRCGTPLLYYAKTSWFIKTSARNKELLANNATVNWIPSHIRDGRFGQWLREGKDWALSRERYWGTPLPIWTCSQCGEHEVIDSVKELEKKSVTSHNTYYVMRHGATNRNELHDMIINFRRETDVFHLTEDGKKTVEQTAELLNHEGIDLIFCSPFNRTRETAEVIGKILHKEITIDERLHEVVRGMGDDGKHESTIASIRNRTTMKEKEDGGESWDDARLRLADFMRELDSKYKNKKILIVTHAAPAWLLATMGQGLTGDHVMASKTLPEYQYPRLAESHKLIWRKIPRNEYGELDLHRPFIDDVVLKCAKCKSKMKKIPDLIDVWFDSGAMPYAQWHYPFDDKKQFKQQFPADFIVEGMDQTRGWFYTLLAISTLLDNGAPYKNVMTLGFTLDEKGVKESKSKGNYTPIMELMDRHGVDILRWYFASTMTAGENKAVIGREIDDKLKGFFFTLQNCLRFYELNKPTSENQDEKLPKLTKLDAWILARLNRVLADATTRLDAYDVAPVARDIEKFVIEDLSNWFVRRSRKRPTALPVLRQVLLVTAQMLAPFTPFMAEELWQQLQGAGQSVHLSDWPRVSKKYLDEKLEAEMAAARDVVTRGLALRKEKSLKVRQPLAALKIDHSKFNRDIENLIKDELNVKKIAYGQTEFGFDFELTPVLIREGYAREAQRMIQDMRKEAHYRMEDLVHAQWHSDDKDIVKAINDWTEEIKKDTQLATLEQSPKGSAHDIEKEMDLAPNKKIWLGIKK